MIHTKSVTGFGDGTVALSIASIPAQWVEIYVSVPNVSASNNTGDGSVSLTVGRPILKGASFLYPPLFRGGYDLNQIYIYLANGDTVIVTYDDFN